MLRYACFFGGTVQNNLVNLTGAVTKNPTRPNVPWSVNVEIGSTDDNLQELLFTSNKYSELQTHEFSAQVDR